MSNNNKVEFDFDAMTATANRLDLEADALEQSLQKAVEKVWSTAVKEASLNTASGEPAPIYGDIINGMAKSFTLLTEMKIQQITSTMRGDAATLRAVVAEARGATDEAVGALNGVARAAYAAGPTAVEAAATERQIDRHLATVETAFSGMDDPATPTSFQERAGVPGLTAAQQDAVDAGEAHVAADGDVETVGGGSSPPTAPSRSPA